MKIIKKYKSMVLSIAILLVITILGFSYAYTKSNVTVVTETQTIIKSKKLALLFNDTREIKVSDMMPGKVVEKTFNVTSDANEELTYNIKYKDITNTYNEDVVYTLIRDNEVVATKTPMPKTKEEEYILTNIKIESGEKHEYVLKIEYLNTDKAQTLSKEDIFAGTIEIDVIDKTAELIYVPYETNEITSTDTTEENTIINEFTVRNSSSVQTQNYNILLDELENEYESGELTYSLEKNGEEVSSGNVPKEGELPYLTTDVNLAGGQTDTYKLTITENVDDTLAYAEERYEFSLLTNEVATKALSKKFSAKIVIDKKEVDTTPPSAVLTYVTKTTNSVTFKASCSDDESGIANYKFYKNGNLVETKELTEENIEYTYKKLETKEYEFKLVCTNKYGVETKASDKITPTGLVEPKYEVASGAAQSKTVDITYTGEGTYLFKINGEVISNVDVIDCGETSIEGTFSCSETKVDKGTKLSENIWYKVESNPTLTFTSNGNVIAKIADGTNYVSGSSLDITGIDREAPSIPEVESEYALGSWTNKEVVLKVSSTDNVKVDYYEYKVGDSSWKKVSGNEIKFTEDMEEVVSIRAIDAAENISGIKEVEVKIDTKKPEIEFSETENTTYKNSQSTKVNVSDNVEIQELKYAWSTSDKEPTFGNTFTNGDTLTIDSVTGKHYLWIYAKDSAGNVTTTKSGLFYLDNTNPTCNISGEPTTWATSATLSVSGSDTEKINTKPYSWDGTNYSTTQTNKVDSNGTYTAYVKDEAGNVGSCSKEVNKIDTTVPSSPTLSVSSKTTNSIVLSGGCSDAESGITIYEFYMDGTLNKSYSTANETQNHTINNIKSGSHTYKLVCTNGAKLTNNTSLTVTTEEPNMPVYSVPSGYAQSKNVTISYSGDGAYLFKATGSVTSNVVVTDCGTTSTEGTYSCTTTTVAAGTALTAGKWYKVESNPTLTFTSNGSIIAKVADGTNYKAGSTLNVDGIDRTGPEVTFSPTSNTTWAKSQSSKVSVSDVAGLGTLKYYWTTSETTPADNAFTTTFTSGATITKSDGTGKYYLWIYAKDKAENVTKTKAGLFYIDNTIPSECTITGNPTSYAQSATLKVSGADANSGLHATQAYSWDGTTYSTTQTKSITANGTYTAYVKDNVGNVKSCSVEVTKIDREGPSITFGTNGNTTYAKSQSSKVTASDVAEIKTLKYYWSTSSATPTDASFTTTFTNASTITKSDGTGKYYLWIYAEDSLGNKTKKNTTNTFYIDNTPPSCTISGLPEDWTISTTLKVSGSDDDSGLATSPYSWNGSTYSTTQTKTINTNGTYTAYVKDKANNVQPCSVDITKIDNDEPSITNIGMYIGDVSDGVSDGAYTLGEYTNKAVKTEIYSSDGTGSGINRIEYSLDNGSTWANLNSFSDKYSYGSYDNNTNYQYWINKTGSWDIIYRVVDNMGNVSAATSAYKIRIEKSATAPTFTSSSGTANSITAVYNAGSAQSGIKTTTCYYGTTSSPATVGTLSGNNCVFSNLSSNTTYYFKKCITSNYGNTACSTTKSLLTAGGVYNYDYSGAEKKLVIPVKGKYKLETWGAQGGTINSSYVGGYGGYSTGQIVLSKSTVVYINVGGTGGYYQWPSQSYTGNGTETTVSGGYNGGGAGKNIWSGSATALQYNTSGGGATHIATKSGLLSSLANNIDSILIVSGGGGGSQYFYQDNGNNYSYCNASGSGGGIYGNATVCNGTNGVYVSSIVSASQTGGGTSVYNNSFGSYGSFGQGASGYSGGGGGFYGGTGNYQITGGGSGYIGNTSLTNKAMYCYKCTTSTATNTLTYSTTNVSSTAVSNYAKSGNGYAKITILSTSS